MLNTAIKFSKTSSNILLKYFWQKFWVETKDFKDIVTQADIESENNILKVIKESFPEHSIFSEEAGLEDQQSEYMRFIDPLDGTGNFERTIPVYGISAGLTDRNNPILWVISIPSLNNIFSAEQEKWAFKNEKKITVSDRDISKSFVYIQSPWKEKERVLKILDKVSEKVQMTRIFDASAFSLSQVADWSAEAYIHTNSVPHDVIAWVVLIREAWGRVTDWNGKERTLESKNILASNWIIHNELLEIIKNI